MVTIAAPSGRFKLRPWTLRFADPEVERTWRIWRSAETLGLVRASLVTAMLAVGLKWFSEVGEFPEEANNLALLRFAWGIPYLGITLALTWWSKAAQRLHTLLTVSFLGFAALVYFPFFFVWPIEFAQAWPLSWIQLLCFCAFLFGLDFAQGLVLSLTTYVLFRITGVLLETPEPIMKASNAIFLVVLTAGLVALYQLDRRARLSFALQNDLAAEKARSETLLLALLPASVARRLQTEDGGIADAYAEVTVLFTDLVGFTTLAGQISPGELVDLLDRLFGRFDALVEQHGLEKIKTVGDAYMVAGNLPEPREGHELSIVQLGLDMIQATHELAKERGVPLELRVGAHLGPAVAGVIGKRRFLYDVWGDTVNTAARMESHGIPGRLQISEALARAVSERFDLEDRGTQAIKGKGLLRTFLVNGPLHA